MQEYWEEYMKPIDGYPAIVAFNAGITDYKPDEEYMHVGFINLKLNNPTEKGFIRQEEKDELGFIEDRIEMESLHYKIGKYVGRIITQGEAHFIYYLKSSFEWKSVVTDAMGQFDGYSFEYGSKMDIEWEVYKKLLFPTLQEWQIIHNHHTCNAMTDAGDTLKVPRAIEHTSYFQNKEDKDSFIENIIQNGFHVHKDKDQVEENTLFKLQFYRIDAPHHYDIDDMTLELIALCKKFDGEYDGWECSIVVEEGC